MQRADVRLVLKQTAKLVACATLIAAASSATAQLAPQTAATPTPAAKSAAVPAATWPTTQAASVATPHDIFGGLYEAVQKANIYPDAKTFADAVPKQDPQTILAQYRRDNRATPQR